MLDALYAAGNVATAYLTNEANKDVARSNNEWSAAQYASRYQTQVEDLKKAGLSPMLAYSANPGSAPTAQQVTLQNPMAGAAEGFRAMTDSSVKRAQVDNILADTALKERTADQVVAQTNLADSQARLADSTASEAAVRMNSKSNYDNPTQQALAASYWSQVSVNKANLNKIASEINANGAYAAQARAQAFKAISEGRITQADYQRALNDEKYERYTGGAIRQTARDLGSITGAASAARRAGMR